MHRKILADIKYLATQNRLFVLSRLLLTLVAQYEEKKMMNHFAETEFKCPCCGKNEMNLLVYDKIDRIREKLNWPLHINSGFRCVDHNREVGGKEKSMHLSGKAIDVSTANMTELVRHEFLRLVHFEFNGVGIGKTFFHMDIRDIPACWVY